MHMERSMSSIGAAETGQAKRKNSVHYPKDSQLLQIVPPPSRGISGQRSKESRASIDHGAAAGEFRRLSIRDRTPIDIDHVPDDRTPIDIDYEPDDATPDSKVFDNIDTSYVFGDFHGMGTHTWEHDEQTGDVRNGKKNSSKEKKHKTPGQRIVLFALRLALIEKAASGIGTLSFVWATVVILGGFASTITFDNFWVVTLIILAEGSRIFSRSHELEWQQLSSKSSGGRDLTHRLLRAARPISGSLISSSYSYSKTGYNHRFRRPKASSDTAHQLPTVKSAPPHADLPTRTNTSSSTRGQPPVATVTAQTSPLLINSPSESRGTWSMSTLPLLPYVGRVLTTHVMSQILYCAQLNSAMMCIGLSLWRLILQDFYYEGSDDPINLKPSVTVSMNVFYVLAVLEAGLFLLERSYWEYRIRVTKLLDHVRDEVDLGKAELGKADFGTESADVVRQFFYDVYGRCLAGSIFDGLDMDLVSYSISWLQYENFKQQLAGSRLLNRFVTEGDKPRKYNRFAANALRRLGTTPGIIERLVEMLSWNSTHEKVLLQEIATIVCRLVVYNRNCSRFVAVPGFTDGVVALLLTPDNQLELRLMGLRILKYLCKDHKNCVKIGETKGLMSILMLFIEVRGGANTFADDFTPDKILKGRLKTFKKSLQVLLLLAATTSISGGVLRRKIAAIISGLKNLRDVIEFGSERPELQRLSVEILYHLAMEEDVRRNIGATGGTIRNLLYLFGQYDSVREWAAGGTEPAPVRKMREQRRLASEKAGETLTRLVLQNERNCVRLLQVNVGVSDRNLVPCMINSLYHPDTIASSAAKVLRSVLRYADDSTKVMITRSCVPVIVQNIFRPGPLTKSEMYEASLGLASRALEFLDAATYKLILQKVNKTEFVERLMKNLQHTATTNKYPRIRRFSVELILALTPKDDSFLDAFQRHNLDLKSVLIDTLDSISEVENFCLFSGFIGYTRHSEEMEDLVERCIKAVDDYHTRAISSETSL